MGPEFRVYLIMVFTVLAGALLGALLLRNGWKRAFGAFAAGHLLAAIGLFVAIQGRAQMEVLIYAILLSTFVLPATFGLVIGGALGWWMRRKGP
jgi:hypothetical protein